MTEQAKVPAIRFAGFTDPWEQRKLGEFGSVAMCKRIYKEQTSEQGDVPFFKIGTFGADPDAFISNELFEDYKRTYPYPTPGTLLISAAGSIGRIVEYQGEKAYFQDSNIVWLEHDHRLNDAFLKPLYSKIEWGLEGSTIKRLYNKDLLSAEVTIPDGREQKEIGQFFAKLDSLITLHQRKYDKLVVFKKSMLEKMFPKDGESVPEIRFAGFTDPWEQRKFSEIVDVCSGRDYKHLDEGPIPVYGTGGYMTSVSEALSHNRDAIGIGRKGTIDKPYLLKAPFWTVDTLFYAIPKSDINLEFALCSFLNVDWKSKDESTGLPSLSKESINETVLSVPNVVEQNHLGNFFADLDRLITLHQRKYDKLVILIKSMLEKMFPKDGESVPEIRFAGFTDPWEQRKLEDIANRVTRKNEGESDLPLTISSQYGLVDQRTFFNNQVASKDMSGYYLLRKGEFAYNKSTSGDSPWGAVKRLVRYEKGCVSTLYICFGLDGADPDFLVTYYETDRWYKAVQMIAAEGARNHGLLNIAPNDFFDTALILPPSREEQELIGLFFARLDNLITLHQRKLELLQNIKKSLLDKMFV